MNRLEDLKQQLAELESKRADANQAIAGVEQQLAKLVHYRTRLDGAVEWISDQIRLETEAAARKDAEAQRRAADALGAEKLTQAQ